MLTLLNMSWNRMLLTSRNRFITAGGNNNMIIKEIETKSVMTKSNLPVSDYSVNPYVGCAHACKYCYASFMKRFTNHPKPWGEFIDVKLWPMIKNRRNTKARKRSSPP